MNSTHKMKELMLVLHGVMKTILPTSIKQEEPEETYVCGGSYNEDRLPEIDLYSREVSSQLLWTCCGQKFEDFILFNQHKEQEHEFKPLECSVCTLSFPSLPDLEEHYIAIHNRNQVTSFRCLKCKAVFGVQTSFSEHKKHCASCLKGPNPDETVLKNKTVDRKITAKRKKIGRASATVKQSNSFRFVCCEETFVNFAEFNIHKFVKHNIEQLVCGLCSREKKSTSALYKHYLQIHFTNCAISISNHKPKRKTAPEERKKMSIRKMNGVLHNGGECSSESDTSCDDTKCTAQQEGILCKCSTCTKIVRTFQPANEIDEVDEMASLKPHVCKICKQRFYFGSRLKRHLKTHLGLKEYPCDLCGNSFTKKISLDKHKLYKHSSNPLRVTCDICSKDFVCKSSLQKHVRLVHLRQGKNVRVHCKYCEKTFAHSKSLSRHINELHLRGKKFICGHCDHVFYDKSVLTYHIKRLHLPQEVIVCEICGFITSNKVTLAGHMHRKHSQRQFGCEICGKMFTTKKSLEMHRVGHFDEKPFVCQTCGKGFKREANLLQHQYTHRESRPHICSICGQSFRLRTHVKQHMAVHGLVKNHKCIICSKMFARKGELNLHLSDHAWLQELTTSTVSH